MKKNKQKKSARNYYARATRLIKENIFFVLNCFVIFTLLLLPYFLFQGKLFLGGDDTRLFYAYPKEYLLNAPLYSWLNLSSIGWNFSYQTFIPFVTVWVILAEVVKSKIILSYFSFSFPFILGFVFFQKLITELVLKNNKVYKKEFFLGSIFYIFSPIIIHNHFLNPLIPIWLIGIIPAVFYYFLRFIKTGRYIHILLASAFVTIFSFGYHNIPWGVGFLIPMFLALPIGLFIFKRTEILFFLKRFALFFSIVLLSQSFWLISLFITLIDSSSSNFTAKAVSDDVVNNFSNSVRVTAQGFIIHPLLNLYHRKIAFDFAWNLKNVYISFYDKIYFIFLIYVVTLFFGILNIRRYASILETKIFFILLVSFLLSLYLFTVNIGPLLDAYILMGNIPGFGLFRNPYDKFALGFTLIYSILLTYCLIIINRKYNNYFINKIFLVLFLLACFINILPIKQIIVSPLWTTKNIYKNISLPNEYLKFMRAINNTVPSSSNIFSIPYGLSLYTIIKDVDTNNVYAGVSPVVVFSGVNDISGFLSFNYAPEGNLVNNAIKNRDYKKLNEILYSHYINYVFLTKNIPEEVKKSYLFVQDILKVQDGDFISKITYKKILTSTYGNYELYSVKRKNSLNSSNNLLFKKINRVKYKISLKNVKGKQKLFFNDTYHSGWKLYSSENKLICKNINLIQELNTSECPPNSVFFEISDLMYLWKSSKFSDSHKVNNNFSNQWIIDSESIKKQFKKNTYHLNKDGSIDIDLVLYFRPQTYFYIGSAISILTIVTLLLLITFKRK